MTNTPDENGNLNCEDCENCNDCVYCYGCKNCNNCGFCKYCEDCEYCRFCDGCDDCKGCEHCNDWIDNEPPTLRRKGEAMTETKPTLLEWWHSLPVADKPYMKGETSHGGIGWYVQTGSESLPAFADYVVSSVVSGPAVYLVPRK